MSWAAGLAAAGSIAAAALSRPGSSSGGGLTASQQRGFRADDFRRQIKFRKTEIQDRLSDARKAGIHPLSALGISPSSYTAPQLVGTPSKSKSGSSTLSRSLRAASQSVESYQQKQLTQNQQDLHKAQVSLLQKQAQNEESQSQYYTSMAAKNAQSVYATKPIPAIKPQSELENHYRS